MRRTRGVWTRRGQVAAWLAGVAVLAASSRLAAEETHPPDAAACAVWESDYTLAATLQVRDTLMGAGDGTYPIGPGRAVVRMDADGTHARLVSYAMHSHVVAVSKALFWTTTVISDSETSAPPDASGAAAEGSLSARRIDWTTPVRGYRSEGTLDCDGHLCGSFGAPPPGKSPVHIAPHAVPFNAFEFSADKKTFTMAATQISKADSPKQTSYVALSGRETRRTCVTPAPAH